MQVVTAAGATDGTPDGVSESPQCGLCNRAIARYVCPRCGVPYCSLPCYTTRAHTRCVQTFQHDHQQDLTALASKSGLPRTSQQQHHIHAILSRFEAQTNSELDLGFPDSGVTSSPSLQDRFDHLDLNALDGDAIWRMLTERERREFMQEFVPKYVHKDEAHVDEEIRLGMEEWRNRDRP